MLKIEKIIQIDLSLLLVRHSPTGIAALIGDVRPASGILIDHVIVCLFCKTTAIANRPHWLVHFREISHHRLVASFNNFRLILTNPARILNLPTCWSPDSIEFISNYALAITDCILRGRMLFSLISHLGILLNYSDIIKCSLYHVLSILFGIL